MTDVIGTTIFQIPRFLKEGTGIDLVQDGTNQALTINVSADDLSGILGGSIVTTDYHQSARVAATSNITLFGTQTIDGVELAADDRVLLTGQTSAADNRIWVVGASDWTIADGWDVGDTVNDGCVVAIQEGTASAGKVAVLSADAPITLGTTPLTWALSASTEVFKAYYTPIDRTEAAFTLTLNDGGKWMFLALAGAQTVTIPTDAAVAFPVGTEIVLQKTGSGDKTISVGGSVTLNGATSTSVVMETAYDSYVLKKQAINPWKAATTEAIQDAVSTMWTGGTHTGISFSYNDAGNVMDATVSSEFIQDSAASMLTAGYHVGMTTTYTDASDRLSLIVDHKWLKQPNVAERDFVNGIPWVIRTSAADNEWRAIAWSAQLGLFCAVASTGTGNRVMTSPDGITWTARTSAADNEWYGVSWSPELSLFAAVAITGTGNRVMTSPDGITWTARTSAADNQWRGITWSSDLGLFCAVANTGTGNRVMTSPDGITWTSRTNSAGNQWRSVAWSPRLRLFAAVANSGTGTRVMTSPDGITWTTRTSAADNSWLSVTWSPELSLFCAVAVTGTGDRVMTSPDGIAWTTRTSAADNQWTSVEWSAELGMFVAVSVSGTGNRVMTSPDGITWTARTSAADNSWQGNSWSPQLRLFASVASSGSGNRVMTSMSSRYYGRDVEVLAVAASDETTALTTGTAKVTFRVPVNFRCTEIYATLTTAQSTGSLLTVDVNVDGTSMMTTSKLVFDNTEKTTRTAATPPVLTTNRIAAGSEITVDIDTVGDGTAKVLKVYLVGFGFK